MDYKLSHVVTSQRGAGALILRPEESRRDRTVVVLHGLGSDKENTLAHLFHLAAAGFDTVAIDLYLHGDRPEAGRLQQQLYVDFAGTVRDIIRESAADVPAICAEIGVDIARAGLVGISAGGFVAHVLAIQRPQFKAMVAAISSPDWLTIDPMFAPDPGSSDAGMLAEISPVNHPDRYAPIPICLLNAAGDDVVSAEGTVKLVDRLTPIYRAAGIESLLKSKVYPEAGHYYTRDMVVETIDWMTVHL